MLDFELKKGDRPTIYDLKIEPDARALTISTSSQVAELTHETIANTQIAQVLVSVKEMGIQPFISPEKTEWGYGPAIQTVSELDTVSWICEIPSAESEKLTLKALSASLKILFWVLNFKSEEFKTNQDQGNQLLDLQLTAEMRMDGGGMIVTLAPAFIRWLATMPSEFNDRSIIETMKKTAERMSGRVPFGIYDAWFQRSNWVGLTVPGSAAGLYPGDHQPVKNPNRGYQLFTHNIDSAGQQLTLLAGLADMHGKARAAGF